MIPDTYCGFYHCDIHKGEWGGAELQQYKISNADDNPEQRNDGVKKDTPRKEKSWCQGDCDNQHIIKEDQRIGKKRAECAEDGFAR